MAAPSSIIVGLTFAMALGVSCAQGTVLSGDQLGNLGGASNGAPSGSSEGGAGGGTGAPAGNGGGSVTNTSTSGGNDTSSSTYGSGTASTSSGSGASSTTGASSSGNGASSSTSSSAAASSASSAASSSTTTSASSSSGTTTCAHSDCDTGTKLSATCDPCVATICATKPSCCSNTWGAVCVGDVLSICGDSSCPAPTCAHPLCTAGGPLAKSCDPCAAAVCAAAADPYCCDQALGEWDDICVGEVDMYCTTTTC